MNAIDRVQAVLEVSGLIADPHHALGTRVRERLRKIGGLSESGIELALREHLETDVGAEEIAAFVARAPTAPRCHVLLSANVCTAAVRAIAWAAATASEVSVKPSRRDPVVADALIETLAGRFAIRRVETLAPNDGDHVHLYGSDETVEQLQHVGGTVFAHGTGIGIAAVDEVGDAAASALCRDMVPFDGRGCMSPRVAFVLGDVHEFARMLQRHLHAAATRVPRGPLTTDELGDIAQYGSAYRAVDGFVETKNHFIAIDSAPQTLLLPPAHRGILLASVEDAEHMTTLLQPWRQLVVCCGVTTRTGALALQVHAPGVRQVALGTMQKPPFDGPVDLRLCS